jgi:hypothetical protein
MKKLLADKTANIDMILTAIVAAIVFAVSIAIVYAVLGGIDYSTYDANIGNTTSTTPAANASDNLITNMDTFYNLGPIYIVVIAAVGIIAAVLMVRMKR